MRSLAPHCHVCFGSSDSSPQQQGDQLFVVGFFFVLVTQVQWVFYLLSNVGKNVFLFCYVVFAPLVDANSKRNKDC